MYKTIDLLKILTLILLVALASDIKAEDLKGAIGVRFKSGYDKSFYSGGELSFQHKLKGIRRAEYDLGFAGSSSWNGFQFTYLYQWRLIRKGRFNFYLGTGPSFAYINQYYDDKLYVLAWAGDIGVDYSFGFPIQIAFDWRPMIDIYSDLGDPVGYDVGLSIRLGF